MLKKGYSLEVGGISVTKEHDSAGHPYWCLHCGAAFTKRIDTLQEAFEEAREKFVLPEEADRMKIVNSFLDMEPEIKRFVMSPLVPPGMSISLFRSIDGGLFNNVVVNVTGMDRSGFHIQVKSLSWLNDRPFEKFMTPSDGKTYADRVEDFRASWVSYLVGLFEANDAKLNKLKAMADHMEKGGSDEGKTGTPPSTI